MGTWGHGPFDNDTAADWAGDLDDAAPSARPALVREALAAAANVKPEDYLDGDDAAAAIAAAAILARRLFGGPELDETYGPAAETVAGLELDAELSVLATRALLRVMSEESEWRETWEEADELDDARRALDVILAALDA